jgi:prolyl 4-hydroxylase
MKIFWLLFLLCVIYIGHRCHTKYPLYRNVLTSDEIAGIQRRAVFRKSTVVGTKYNPDVRVSETAWIDDPALIRKLLRRVGLKHKTIAHCEQLQVVRYRPGGFFKPHYDSLKEPYASDESMFQKGGHRDYTLLIALSDDYEGGETVFPNHRVRYKLKKGDALLFRNVNHKGELINFHGGDPVRSGTKWIVNLWTHEHSVR